jgi:ATP-dependent Clp protease ATP-binding subunit ClpC
MFERFTDRARRTVVVAQQEAGRLNHNYIGTEHLLLGLLYEGEGTAAQALGSLGVNLDAARLQVVDIIGTSGSAPTGHIPFTPRAKRVLELSMRESLGLGHNYIGTEHLLLGLLSEGEGVAVQVLERLGVTPTGAHDRVLQILGRAPEGGVQSGPAVMEASTFLSRGAAGVSQLAEGRGDQRLGSEHVLLWLLDQADSAAVRALRDEGVDLLALRARLVRMLDDAGGSTDPGEPGGPDQPDS